MSIPHNLTAYQAIAILPKKTKLRTMTRCFGWLEEVKSRAEIVGAIEANKGAVLSYDSPENGFRIKLVIDGRNLLIETTRREVPEDVLEQEQMDALVRYAARKGRNWKSHLISAWSKGTDDREQDGGLLRKIRNVRGPVWLQSFTLPRHAA